MTLSVLHACDYNDVSASGDYYSILRENTWLTKRIDKYGNKLRANFPKKFRLGKYYNPSTLEDLYPILEILGNDPKALIIRHKYKEHTINNTVFRQAKFVENAPSKIICMDIDELDLPLHISSTDIEGQGEYVCNILNKCNSEVFPDDMGFIAQGSSSAGLSKTIKLHLWLQNYDEIDQSQLRNLFSIVNSTFKTKYGLNTNLVDPALYHDIQAHYTAYPIFEEDSTDPLKGKRMIYSRGNYSYVPEQYSSYIKPVKTTLREQELYLTSIAGGRQRTVELEKRIEFLHSWDPARPGFRNKVISIYHEAIQSQYCLELLKGEIAEVVERKRPGQLEDYIQQGKSSAVSNIKACSTREIPEKSLGLSLQSIHGGDQETYLDMERFPPKNSVTFLRATLGTGKTYTIQQWLEGGHIQGKFLAITDTSALVNSNTERFAPARDFRNTLGRLDFATGKVDRLSGTLHSLLKIKDFTNKFDFLFIDEADSLMNNLLFAGIISEEKRVQIIEVLRELLQNTDRVVISDGDISEETVAQYINLMEGSRKLCRVNHRRKNLKGVTAYKHEKESSLWGALQGHLELGDKCLVVSDSSPKVLNEYWTTFNRLMPQKQVKVVHSASTNDPDVTDIIDNTTVALRRQEIDALLCSPSITNGVDFNYFDVVLILTTSENHTPNMRFQAMMRERHPGTIHYFFSHRKQHVTGYSGVTISKDFLPTARKSYALRREREYKTYVSTFNYYLVDAGAMIEVIDIPYDSPLDAIDKEDYNTERILAIMDSKEGVSQLRHNDAYEMKQMIKHYYEIDELSWDDTAEFIADKPEVHAEFFHKLYPLFGTTLLTHNVDAITKALSASAYKYYLATGEPLPYSKGEINVKKVLSKCGIKKDTKDILHWYRKYCEYTQGVVLPIELSDKEAVSELA